MRGVAVRSSRCLAGRLEHAVVTRQAPQTPSTLSSSSSGAAIVEQTSNAAARVSHAVESSRVVRGAEAAMQRAMAGSCSGTAYAPDAASSPLLAKVLQRPSSDAAPRPPEPLSTVATASASPSVPEPLQRFSLAELQRKPAAELRQLLVVRGVGMGSATDKADLAQWVHQHQDLPITQPNAKPPCYSLKTTVHRPAMRPMTEAELHNLSIRELRVMLKERGVNEGTATEKGELVRWVWQHQDLPVLYHAQQRARQRGKGRHWFGTGSSEPYDVHDNPQDERQKLEENERPEQLEGADQEQRLLEAGSDAGKGSHGNVAQQVRRLWMMAGLSVLGLLGAVGALAVLDAQRSQPAAPPSIAGGSEATA